MGHPDYVDPNRTIAFLVYMKDGKGSFESFYDLTLDNYIFDSYMTGEIIGLDELKNSNITYFEYQDSVVNLDAWEAEYGSSSSAESSADKSSDTEIEDRAASSKDASVASKEASTGSDTEDVFADNYTTCELKINLETNEPITGMVFYTLYNKLTGEEFVVDWYYGEGIITNGKLESSIRDHDHIQLPYRSREKDFIEIKEIFYIPTKELEEGKYSDEKYFFTDSVDYDLLERFQCIDSNKLEDDYLPESAKLKINNKKIIR